MKWSDAIKQVAKPSGWTNREASGLIGFARSAYNTFGKAAQVSLTPIDWYAFTLPALGWSKVGDKFKVDTAHQLAKYPASAQLAAALAQLAAELDAQGVAFRVLVDPRGTDASFRALATDAWAAMQQEAKGEGGTMPGAELESAATAAPGTTARKRGRAALVARIANPAHARWFVYGENKDGTWITAEAGDEAKAKASYENLAGLDTIAYAAYWDTSATKLKPASEFAGVIDVVPDADSSGGSGGGAWLALLALLAFGKKRRA